MSLRNHAPEQVAHLIHASAPELFAVLYGSSAIAILSELVKRSHNRQSYRYIRVAAIDRQVVGVAVLVPADHLNDDTDYREVLTPLQQIWLKTVRYFVLQYLVQYNYPSNSFYISNLAVLEHYRNQGIGRQLLLQCIAEANPSSIFISVDVNNGRAQKLYESLGFQVINQKTISFGEWAIGSRILKL